ncbi:MAG: SDR family oxidoreductase [Cyclobacteriaceae bacterium]
MDLDLKNKTALVAASSSGIGKAIAKSLAQEGVDVCLLARDEGKLKFAQEDILKVAKGKVVYTVCDLASKDQIDNAYEFAKKELGEIDILVNNQGGPKPGEFDTLSEDDIESSLNINLKSVLRLTRLCLPSMQKRKYGRILNVLSISAKEPLKGMFLSNTVRPAVLGFAKSLATQYAESNITVNSLLPSSVMTERTRFLVGNKAEADGTSYEQALAECVSSFPSKHIAEEKEISSVAAFLCSPLASYINGVALAVDGSFSKSIL